MSYVEAQRASAGISADAILAEALRAAAPADGLRWIDIGCGEGNLLRRVLRDHGPRDAVGVDVVDFLLADLRESVELHLGTASEVLPGIEAADRVVMSEVIEHLEAPWVVLRQAARLVAPGGRIVVTTPNVAALRSRLALLVGGELTAFREDNAPHVGPALPHVIARVLADEGMVVEAPTFAEVDVVPLTGGRRWPRTLARRRPDLACISVVVAAARPTEAA